MKKFPIVLLLLLVIAHSSTVLAQMSQGRLWSPVASDQFGGGARLRSGFWGEIDYNYWLITQGKQTVIGWDAAPIGTHYYASDTTQARKNTISTDMLEQQFEGGTTIRFGNQIGHHGWELKTTILQAQSSVFQGYGGEMDINDQFISTARPFIVGDNDHNFLYRYDPVSGPQTLPDNVSYRSMPGGALWGWVAYPGIPSQSYIFTPLPIFFDDYTIRTRVSHWDVEANYIFRMHPTRFGFFEFTGGVRYFQLDDNLGFESTGRPYASNGVGNILADSNWNFTALNRIVGPQVGMRYIRKIGRWSLIANSRFFAGFNAQRMTSRGTLASDAQAREESYAGEVTPMDMYVWTPSRFSNNSESFNHAANRTEFSPGVDFSLMANWQMTDAIGITLGYQGMYIDNTARSSLVNDYTLFPNGQIFGINENVNDTTWMHGFTIGITINRF